jgi:hypothetical protein
MAGVASGSIKVEGLQQTIKSLQALGADRAEIQNANYEAAVTLINEARPLVPVRSGRLRASLRPARATNYATARAGLANVPYANPIHWGWFRDKQTGVNRNVLPQPFFSKALGYTKDEIIANYNRNMQQLVNKHGLGK